MFIFIKYSASKVQIWFTFSVFDGIFIAKFFYTRAHTTVNMKLNRPKTVAIYALKAEKEVFLRRKTHSNCECPDSFFMFVVLTKLKVLSALKVFFFVQ